MKPIELKKHNKNITNSLKLSQLIKKSQQKYHTEDNRNKSPR